MLCIKLLSCYIRYLSEILQAESLAAKVFHKSNFYKIPKAELLPITQWLIVTLNHRTQPTVSTTF